MRGRRMVRFMRAVASIAHIPLSTVCLRSLLFVCSLHPARMAQDRVEDLADGLGIEAELFRPLGSRLEQRLLALHVPYHLVRLGSARPQAELRAPRQKMDQLA